MIALKNANAAFGWVCALYNASPGDEFFVSASEVGLPGFNFTLSGACRAVLENGEIFSNRTPGHLTAGGTTVPPGRYKIVFDEPTEFLCCDAKRNKGFVPTVSALVIPAGSSRSATKGTLLYLCSGTLSVGANTFSAPKELAVESGDKEITAQTDCLALIFERRRSSVVMDSK